jgi:hypothetical protein
VRIGTPDISEPSTFWGVVPPRFRMRLITDQWRALRLLDEAEPRGCTALRVKSWDGQACSLNSSSNPPNQRLVGDALAGAAGQSDLHAGHAA